MPTSKAPGRIRVGIGGWNYEPWRKTFYPPGTARTRELEYASQRVTSIEINGTFYRLQKPEVFGKWHDATPKEFMFSVKAPRFIVQRKDLSSAGTAVERFLASGIDELKSKLGPHPLAVESDKAIRCARTRSIFGSVAREGEQASPAARTRSPPCELLEPRVSGHCPSPWRRR